MKLLHYILLVLILCNIPSIILVGFSDTAGSLSSYATYVLLLLYYFLNKKHAPAWPFLIFAILFYAISGLVYVDDQNYFLYGFIKYLIIIVCGGELARQTKIKDLYIILVFGALSILIHSVYFPDDYGRYSGFYLDANSAGFVCLLGSALSFAFKNEKWKLIGFFIFTFCGTLTFSRTFFLLWFVLLVVSIFQNRKNLKILSLGIGALILLISVATILKVNQERFSILDSILIGNADTQKIDENSRTETWAQYYDQIYDAPFFGNGFLSFSDTKDVNVGVHNNYLRIIGEAGFIPLLIFLGIYLFMFFKSFKTFRTKIHLTLLAISLLFLHLTNHNFDTINHVTFLSIWLYFRLTVKDNQDLDDEEIKVDEHLSLT